MMQKNFENQIKMCPQKAKTRQMFSQSNWGADEGTGRRCAHTVGVEVRWSGMVGNMVGTTSGQRGNNRESKGCVIGRLTTGNELCKDAWNLQEILQ